MLTNNSSSIALATAMLLISFALWQVKSHGQPLVQAGTQPAPPDPVSAAERQIPDPTRPADVDHHWRYVRGTGWVQVLDIGAKPDAFWPLKVVLRRGAPVVLVSMHASPDLMFLIDSGAGGSYITPEAARRLKVAQDSPVQFGSMTGSVVKIVPSVERSGPLRLDARLDGVLGDDFLGQVLLALDLGGVGEVWPVSPEWDGLRVKWLAKQAQSSTVTAIDLSVRPDGTPLVSADFGSKIVSSLLDTGASQTSITPAAAAGIPHYEVGRQSVSTWAGPNTVSMTLIPSVRVGNVCLRYPVVVESSNLAGNAALIGRDVLAKGTWLLDLAGKCIYHRAAKSAERVTATFPGVELTFANGNVMAKIGRGQSVPPGTYAVVALQGQPARFGAMAFGFSTNSSVSARDELAVLGAAIKSILKRGLFVTIRCRHQNCTIHVPPPADSQVAR